MNDRPFGSVSSREMDSFKSDVQHQFEYQGREIREIKSVVKEVAAQLSEVASKLNRITIDAEYEAKGDQEVVKSKLIYSDRKWAVQLVVFTVVITNAVALIVAKFI